MTGTSRRVALVTGAASGIGFASVIALARRSYAVVATMRDLGGAERLERAAAAEGLDLEAAHLDVTSDDSVARCAEEVLGRLGRIDVVVNSAGAGHLGTLEEVTIADLQRVIDVNCLGTARVTKAFLPAMRSAGRGHLIAMSSTAGIVGHPFNEAYCASKFALEGLYEALAPVAASVGVRVTLIEAGMVRTGFYERSSAARVTEPSPYAEQRAQFERLAQGAETSGQSAEEVAAVIAAVADDPSPHLRYQTAPEVRQLLSRKLADPDGSAVLRLTTRWVT
jgi:NAD(P)-dependent dehydrogenase (short-subunit alcohol dehydrogenase family)